MREFSRLTFPTIPFLFLFLGLILLAVGGDSSSSSNSSSSSTSDADLREEFQRLKDLVEHLRKEVERQKEENKELNSALISPEQWTSQPLKGPAGPAGRKGDRGDAGFPGSDGEDGEKGAKGVTGRDGSQGIPGEKGGIGAVGPRGERGDRGMPGLKGERGGVGLVGPIGDKGDRGLTGSKGDKGSTATCGPEFPNFCTTSQFRFRPLTSHSTSYPVSGTYGHNLNECCILAPPPGQRVSITVTKVKTEAKYDFLEIYKSTNGTFTSLERLSGDLGSSLQKKYMSNVDEPLLLHFHSDASGSSEGVIFISEAK